MVTPEVSSGPPIEYITLNVTTATITFAKKYWAPFLSTFAQKKGVYKYVYRANYYNSSHIPIYDSPCSLIGESSELSREI